MQRSSNPDLKLPPRLVSPPRNKDNLRAFKEGNVRFLVCTDVAARGVDIKGLPYVINMTLPDEPENYIHRIGRVGRQDCLGLAVSIVACDGLKEKVRSRRHRTAHIFCTLSLDVLLAHTWYTGVLGSAVALLTLRHAMHH